MEFRVSEGSLLGGRWLVKRRVGRGTFSEIFEVSDRQGARDASGRHPHLAVKVARDADKCSMLMHEEDVLKDLQGSEYVARYLELGREAGIHYLVMELLGDNLSELRRTTPTRRFTLRTVALLGMQMVEAVRQMHENGCEPPPPSWQRASCLAAPGPARHTAHRRKAAARSGAGAGTFTATLSRRTSASGYRRPRRHPAAAAASRAAVRAAATFWTSGLRAGGRRGWEMPPTLFRRRRAIRPRGGGTERACRSC